MIPAITTGLIALALAAPAAAQLGGAPTARGFEHALPAGSFAFVGCADVDAARRDSALSAWGRLLQDPACATLREGLAQHWQALGATVEAKLGVDALALLELVHGPAALAVTSLPHADVVAHDETAGLGIALLADFGADADEARQLVEQLLDRQADGRAVRSTERFGELEITRFHLPDEAEPGSLSLRLTFHGSTLVVVMGALEPEHDVMSFVLEALDGEGADTLGDLPAFRESLAGQPGGVQLWADLAQLVTFGLQTSRAEAQRRARDGEVVEDADSPVPGMPLSVFVDKLGFGSVGPLSMHSTSDARGSRTRLHLALTGDGWLQGLLRALFSPGAEGHPESVTVACESMTALHVHLPGFIDLGLKIALEAGALAPDELAGFLASMEESLGFDLREDLLALLDGQMTLIVDETEPGEGLPGTEDRPMNGALVLGITDSRSFTGHIEDLIRSRGLHAGRRQLEFQGQEIYHIALPPVAVTYCVLPDALVVSLSSTMLQDVLRHRAAPELPNLADDEDYRAAVGGIRARPGWFSYHDAGRNAAKGIGDLRGVLQTALENLPESPDLAGLRAFLAFLTTVPLPDETVVARYIRGGAISTLTADENGLWMESAGP